MAIFNSYVKLPEGIFAHSLPGASFSVQTKSPNHRGANVIIPGYTRFSLAVPSFGKS
jgi:hypothetical protein